MMIYNRAILGTEIVKKNYSFKLYVFDNRVGLRLRRLLNLAAKEENFSSDLSSQSFISNQQIGFDCKSILKMYL